LIIPVLDTARDRLTKQEQIINIPQQSVITKDNVNISVDGIVFIQVETAKEAVYGLFPIGLGFLVVALLELWVLDFESLFTQTATVLVLGLIITLLFRKKFIKVLGKSSSDKEEQIHTSGIGTIDGKQIKFEGTYWNTDDDLSSYKDGERVNVKIVKNRAVISSKN